MYACQGNDPKPASSPPTILRCAVCFANEMPQPKIMDLENYLMNGVCGLLLNIMIDLMLRKCFIWGSKIVLERIFVLFWMREILLSLDDFAEKAV